jgi:hypothetical protein
MECRVCGTEFASDARYCHRCGARVGADAAGRAGWPAGIPWAAIGAAVGALVTLVALRGGGTATPDVAPVTAPLSAGDISRMSPEEQATRLYNRVMRLDEEGKADSVAFFVPMALQTYAMLPARDADARYHIGLLELVGDNPRSALAQADTINQMAPTHLFAFMLRARAATVRGDAAAVRRAYSDFRRHERAERARGRPEYQDHNTQLDGFGREAAQSSSSP